MFPGSYFSKSFFAGTYFAPADGSTPPVTGDDPREVGFIVNMGRFMVRGR